MNIRIRAVFNAASNASVQSNLVGTVECVGFGSFYPLTGAGKLAPSLRPIGCKTETRHDFANRRFSALQTVHLCLLRFLISFVAF